jgi:Arc/MetJ-type ribon-helix-helix transcriptional regulator
MITMDIRCQVSKDLEQKILREIESGNFSSKAEVARAALREFFKERT